MTLLEGFVPWPADLAARYRAAGLWEGLTVAEMVARTARRRPHHTAVVCGSERLTYAELVQRSRRLADGLLALGLRRGERAVMQLPNTIDFVLTYLALNWIGVIPVMALCTHRQAELRHCIAASGAGTYFIPDVLGTFDYRSMAAEMTVQFRALRHVVVAGEPAIGQQALETLFEETGELAAPPPRADDVSTMLLSGGTASKLIPRSHDDYVLNARLCARAAGFGDDTVFMAILPLGHNYSLASPGMLGTFHAGGTLVIAPDTDTETVFATAARERASVIAAVVPLIADWLDSDVPGRFDLSSLKVVQNGGARLAPTLRARLRERFGCVPQEIYGTAEGLICMTRLDDPDDLVLESSGSPVSEHDEIKVLNDADEEVPDGEPGELVVRGPYTIRGYYQAPQQNAQAFTADGFYRMGDIVRKRGRHVFTEGRRKDLIHRGGEKISCEEVENLIFAHPKVKAVTLVAMPDPALGETACACVVGRPGETLGFDELIAFLRAQGIASFKLPARLELMHEFPLSPVGKILKRELRDIVLARHTGA